MMRLRLALLALLLACGLLVQTGGSANAGEPPTGAVVLTAATHAPAPERLWSLTLTPVPGDLSLVEIDFFHSRHQRISSLSLRVAVRGAFGARFLAAAALRSNARGHARALVLIVNRPTALADLVETHLRISARRALGEAELRLLTNPLTHPDSGLTPALCNVTLHGGALSGSQLRALGSRGASLVGFDAASAVAQAYDVACGLAPANASLFEQAIGHRCGSGAVAQGTLCCPANAICAVPPSQPAGPTAPSGPSVPKTPGCTPCNPQPGSACPLTARTSVCIAAVRRAAVAH